MSVAGLLVGSIDVVYLYLQRPKMKDERWTVTVNYELSNCGSVSYKIDMFWSTCSFSVCFYGLWSTVYTIYRYDL